MNLKGCFVRDILVRIAHPIIRGQVKLIVELCNIVYVYKYFKKLYQNKYLQMLQTETPPPSIEDNFFCEILFCIRNYDSISYYKIVIKKEDRCHTYMQYH